MASAKPMLVIAGFNVTKRFSTTQHHRSKRIHGSGINATKTSDTHCSSRAGFVCSDMQGRGGGGQANRGMIDKRVELGTSLFTWLSSVLAPACSQKHSCCTTGVTAVQR